MWSDLGFTNTPTSRRQSEKTEPNMKTRKDKAFTCPETEGLDGVCRLCGEGLDGHDADYRCLVQKAVVKQSLTPHQHSALPWHAGEYSAKPESAVMPLGIIGIGNGSVAIARTMHTGLISREEAEANAAFACLAANSYHELLKIAEDLCEYLEIRIADMRESCDGPMASYDRSDVGLAEAKLREYRKFIAKAEGK
jgi:hypothetical protein